MACDDDRWHSWPPDSVPKLWNPLIWFDILVHSNKMKRMRQLNFMWLFAMMSSSKFFKLETDGVSPNWNVSADASIELLNTLEECLFFGSIFSLRLGFHYSLLQLHLSVYILPIIFSEAGWKHLLRNHLNLKKVLP